MRITSLMLQRSALASLRRDVEQVAKAQDEAITGQRIRRMSDDPVDAAQILRMNSELRDIDQYRRTATTATTRLTAEDVVLGTLQDLMRTAKALALSAAVGAPGDPNRAIALDQVRQIREQILSLGNTKLGDEYLFAGTRVTTAPFLPDGSYAGDTTQRKADIDKGIQVPTNHTGDQVFTGAIAAIDRLTLELQTGTPDSIQLTTVDLGAAQDHALALQTEIGGVLRQIQDTGKYLAQRASNLLDRMEAVRDVDPAQASAQLLSAQNALERAYSIVGKVLSVSLVDVLNGLGS